MTGRDLVVEFPIFGARQRSLKNTLVSAATGGRIARDSEGRGPVVRALGGLTFDLREGDRIGLLGHNGSGKSTLLRVLAGVYEPIRGSLEITGRVASMLSITLGMEPDATGFENIFLRGAILGLTRRETARLVDEVCEFADLGNYINLPLRTYSSGMSMRLAFAISTSIRADIVLMDEWLSVGDAQFATKAQVRLRALIDNAKILVLASHSEEFVRTICNRTIRLSHGEIESMESW